MNACGRVILSSTDFVISADEKTSVQARRRKQPTPPGASIPLVTEYTPKRSLGLAQIDEALRQVLMPTELAFARSDGSPASLCLHS